MTADAMSRILSKIRDTPTFQVSGADAVWSVLNATPENAKRLLAFGMTIWVLTAKLCGAPGVDYQTALATCSKLRQNEDLRNKFSKVVVGLSLSFIF